MVKVKKDLTGQKFGRLTAIMQTEDYVSPNGSHHARWLCECSCEDHNLVKVVGNSLTSGRTQSCGCLQKERVTEAVQKKNKQDLSGEYGVIWTTNTNNEVYFDLEDADKILKHSWHETSDGYVCTSINRRPVRMHVFLGFKWHDHKNRNRLDNRKENLRPCTRQENNRNHSIHIDNISGFTGVMWDSERNKWVAYITINKKWKNLGRYNNKVDAIKTRLKAEKEYFKEFAPQRHLFEEYGIANNNDNKVMQDV